jgi:ankyrin repeat protein
MDVSSRASNAPLTQAQLDAQLVEAAQDGHLTTVSALITAGANVNAVDEFGYTALINAAQNGHTATVSALITGGADINAVNQNGVTALMYAAQDGHTTTVQALITAGANVDAVNQSDSTALMQAALRGQTSIVSALIAAGASIDAVDQYDSTALMWAALNGHTTTVSALISANANVDSVNQYGDTALMRAAQYGHIATFQVLIAAGANVNAVNNRSQTALMLASLNNHRDTAFRLLSTMPMQRVLSLQAQPNAVSNFAGQCMQAVNEIRDNLFHTFWVLQNWQANGLSDGPSALIVSNLSYPVWYQHRFHSDMHLMLERVKQVLNRTTERASAPAALLAPQAPTFTPTATAIRPVANVLSRRNRHEEEVTTETSNKKPRHD